MPSILYTSASQPSPSSFLSPSPHPSPSILFFTDLTLPRAPLHISISPSLPTFPLHPWSWTSQISRCLHYQVRNTPLNATYIEAHLVHQKFNSFIYTYYSNALLFPNCRSIWYALMHSRHNTDHPCNHRALTHTPHQCKHTHCLFNYLHMQVAQVAGTACACRCIPCFTVMHACPIVQFKPWTWVMEMTYCLT